MKNYAARSHEEMKEVLMDADSSGPESHYHMIRGGSDKTNITVWESGTIGSEYIKTYGHYHVGKLDETYTILQGEGVIIMQTRKTGADGRPIDDEIENFKAVKVKAGDKVFIPNGTGHLGVNTGKTWLVTSDDSPVDFGDREPASLPGHADYAPFKKMRGAAYYVVEKAGRPALVRNRNYKTVPVANLEDAI